MEVVIVKSLINGPCSIAMFDYRRVCLMSMKNTRENNIFVPRWSGLCSAIPMLCEPAHLWWLPNRRSTVATAIILTACATNGHCCSQAYCEILSELCPYLGSMILNCQWANYWTTAGRLLPRPWTARSGLPGNWKEWSEKWSASPDEDFDLREIKPKLLQNSDRLSFF